MTAPSAVRVALAIPCMVVAMALMAWIVLRVGNWIVRKAGR